MADTFRAAYNVLEQEMNNRGIGFDPQAVMQLLLKVDGGAAVVIYDDALVIRFSDGSLVIADEATTH